MNFHDAFNRPFAHRGLHDAAAGIIENTARAFEAAIGYGAGYGIECDLRPITGGLPVVFHDETLDRLIDGSGALATLPSSKLKSLVFRGDPASRIITFAELLDLVGGRVPLLVEIKSEWERPNGPFISQIAKAAESYTGRIAFMSFDPDVMALLRRLQGRNQSRWGIVSGSYEGPDWWGGLLTPDRRRKLAGLIATPYNWMPDFYAFDIKALPNPVVTFAQHAAACTIFTWTCRTEADLQKAESLACIPIFEGIRPEYVVPQ
jgi:glycerophosphoryl diester phosphodiesterase